MHICPKCFIFPVFQMHSTLALQEFSDPATHFTVTRLFYENIKYMTKRLSFSTRSAKNHHINYSVN